MNQSQNGKGFFMQSDLKFTCQKCKNEDYSESKISTTGSGLSRFLNMQNNKFVTISCDKCGYTELFKGEKAGAISNIIDIFTN